MRAFTFAILSHKNSTALRVSSQLYYVLVDLLASAPLVEINDATCASQELPRPLSLNARKLPSFLPSVVSTLHPIHRQTNTWERGSPVLPLTHFPGPPTDPLDANHLSANTSSRLLAPRACSTPSHRVQFVSGSTDDGPRFRPATRSTKAASS
jgi:hypothetical protein